MGFFEGGIVAFIVAVILSRALLRQGLAFLSIEDKARLVDLSGGFNSYGVVVVLPLAGIYWLLARYTDINVGVLVIGYFAVALALVIAMQVVNYRKIATLDFPQEYIKRYFISRVIYLAGVTTLFAGFVYDW